MAVPKSAALKAMDAAKEVLQGNMSHVMIPQPSRKSDDGPVIKIKPCQCFNEWVIILQSVIDSSIELSDKYKNEGLVIGVGGGILTNQGRLAPQANIGDRVMFRDRDIVHVIESDTGFYSGKRVVMLNERNLVMLLDPVPFEIVNE